MLKLLMTRDLYLNTDFPPLPPHFLPVLMPVGLSPLPPLPPFLPDQRKLGQLLDRKEQVRMLEGIPGEGTTLLFLLL